MLHKKIKKSYFVSSWFEAVQKLKNKNLRLKATRPKTYAQPYLSKSPAAGIARL